MRSQDRHSTSLVRMGSSGLLTNTPVKDVHSKANYMLSNALQRPSKLGAQHILNRMAISPIALPNDNCRRMMCPLTDNIWTLQEAVRLLPPLRLADPVARIGNRLMDNSSRVSINIPAAPPRWSKVFEQWAKAWIWEAYSDCLIGTSIGTDGLYKIKGKGVSTFVIQRNQQIVETKSQLVGRTHHMIQKCKQCIWPSTTSRTTAVERLLSLLTINPRFNQFSMLSHILFLNFPDKTSLLSAIGSVKMTRTK